MCLNHTYDIIGDVHGCFRELVALLKKCHYDESEGIFIHPEGRMPVFVGDITDRGPASVETIKLVTNMVRKKAALYVPGNHCNKLYRYFLGRNVQITHGLETTVRELQQLSSNEYEKVKNAFMELYENAPLYLRLADDHVVVAHAGIRENLIGQKGKKVKTFVLYGDITGEKHPDGSPVRRDWARHYRGKRLIVYGHTPVHQPRQINNTINIDTGCVFGGALTAFHYPEKIFTMVTSSLPYQKEKFTTF